MNQKTLEMSENSSSIARACWKKFYWRYEEGLNPIRKSTALTLGSAIHEALDLHYKGTPETLIMTKMCQSFDDDIDVSSPEEAEPLVISKYTAMGMFTYFPYKDISQFDEVESEKKFRVELMPGVFFNGRVDGLVKKNGQWWLRELKTTSLTQRQFDQMVSSSTQGSAYVWAMKKLGYDIKGIMFDYIKKPLLRKRVSEDQVDFGSRILDDYKKRQDFYFGQVYSYRTDKQLEMWEQDSIYLARNMLSKRSSKEYYRNPQQCYYFNSECPYKKICFADKPDQLTLELYFSKFGKPIKPTTT